MITIGSLFDGIGGWQLAACHCDADTLWSSEIDKFAKKVTSVHFPSTKQLGDVCNISGAKIEPVDIICAGSPCQDLSIAGKRAGLAGKRSNLFYQAMRIVREMREKTDGKYPKFFIWENVTGAFTSNSGNDFRTVLEEIGQTNIPMPSSGRWARAGMVRSKNIGVCWRVLDAQYWGTPQRRKRIFLVAGFGKYGGAVEKVLFESNRVQVNHETSYREGETDTGCVKGGIENTIHVINDQGGKSINFGNDISPTLRAEAHGNEPIVAVKRSTVACKSYSECQLSDIASTLKACGGVYGGGSENYVIEKQFLSGSQGERIYVEPNVSVTLTGMGGGLGAKTGLYCLKENEGKYIVRKLTPLECERLQGLPDGWTDFGSDSARYKAIGNGMSQPCADFVMKQVVKHIKEVNRKESNHEQ